MSEFECVPLPRIKEVRGYVKKADGGQGSLRMLYGLVQSLYVYPPPGKDCHHVVDQHWVNGYPTPIANPMSSYPRYHDNHESWGLNAMGGVVVEVEAEGGVTGVGEADHTMIT